MVCSLVYIQRERDGGGGGGGGGGERFTYIFLITFLLFFFFFIDTSLAHRQTVFSLSNQFKKKSPSTPHS